MTREIMKFDKNIYCKQAVQQSIIEYKKIAVFNFSETESDYICKIINSTYPEKITAQEFSNFVLGIAARAERIEDAD